MTLSVQSQPQERAFAAHKPAWQRFQTELLVVSKETAAVAAKSKQAIHPYQRQYAHVYHQRLAVLGPRCWDAIPADAAKQRVQRILELKEGVESAAVGTIVKEHSTDTAAGKQEPLISKGTKCCATDALFLEDQSGRVALETTEIHSYTTGMVVGVIGVVGEDGVMQVTSIYSPVPAKDAAFGEQQEASTSTGAPHLLLVSGLQCGGSQVSSLPREMLVSYLEGRFPVDSAAKVSHVVVAGGCTGVRDESTTPATAAANVKELDGFLLQVAAAGIPLDVMPGKDDPTTANWPQRPFHRSLLKQTERYQSSLVSRTPNPYAAGHATKYVLGTDGTNVQDLTVNILSDKQEPVSELEALKRTLQAGHLCPTGPDTVPTIPHAATDPMVMTTHPDIYFAGNCSKFATAVVGGKRLLCLPVFAETGEAILVNLETLQVEVLSFQE